jgi:hypothetical protein
VSQDRGRATQAQPKPGKAATPRRRFPPWKPRRGQQQENTMHVVTNTEYTKQEKDTIMTAAKLIRNLLRRYEEVPNGRKLDPGETVSVLVAATSLVFHDMFVDEKDGYYHMRDVARQITANVDEIDKN